MLSDSRLARRRPLAIRSGSTPARLLCYAVAFALPLGWQYVALALIYPRKLTFTAPNLAGHLADAVPFLQTSLAPLCARTAEGTLPLAQVLYNREQVWLSALALCALAAWALTLLFQLVWRFCHRKPLFTARLTTRAIRSYRLTMLVIAALNAAMAALVWFWGVRLIPGRTLWDYVVSFGIFALLPLSAAAVSRLAASPAISGRHAFFKRI